jgi:hemoglobin
MKKDIETPENCLLLVEEFYKKLLDHEEMRPFFIHLDLKPHIQVVADFWSTILLGTAIYKNNTVAAHKDLPLEKAHFEIWLSLFNETVESLFEGEKAKEAISRARTIGLTMRYKLLGS